MRPRLLVARARAALLTGSVLALAALLAGCDVPTAPAPADRLAATSLADDPAEQAMAAYQKTRAEPDDGATLRLALDQVELALALLPAGHGRRAELAAAEQDLLARFGRLEGGEPPGLTTVAIGPSPEVESPVATASEPMGATEEAPRATASSTAPPAGPAFALATRKSFEGSGNSGQFASCVDIQILGRGGPVGGAVIGVNNGDHSYQDQTDPSGYAGRCGLGASPWSVVLFWTPGGGQIQGATTTVYVSGAPEQRAAVVFQER